MVNFKNKNVFVTGATGFIGSHIVDELMNMENVNVIVLVKDELKLIKAFSQYLDSSRFQYIVQDIVEPIPLDTQKIDYIFHAAGPMERSIIDNYPVNVISPNIIGTINCFELLKRQKENFNYGGRLILFSSVSIYANYDCNDRVVSERDSEITEALGGSNNAYSQSKRMSEVIAQAYKKQFGIDYVVARFSTVYGNTRFIPDTAFFDFIKKAISGENIVICHAGMPRRDNIYIDDAVSGVLTVALKGISGEVYNISSNGDGDNYLSIDEIAERIAKIAERLFGSQTRVFIPKSDSGRKPGLKLDNWKLRKLGWSLQTKADEGLKMTLEEIKFSGAKL